jgi:7-carboxy-7-deazaguanine synthase
MFGKNEIYQKKHFESAPKNTLWVTSIFVTLQGEGPFAGRPAIFIRLAGCNLACSFCDAMFDTGDQMEFKQILEHIHRLCKPYQEQWYKHQQERPLLVLTGGEPLLQPNVGSFLMWAEQTYDTQIESNGLAFQQIPARTHLVVSPKANERTKSYIALSDAASYRADTLKFVIAKDTKPYDDIPEWAFNWQTMSGRDRRIYVSPINYYARRPDLDEKAALEMRSEKNERISFWTEGLLDMNRNRENHEHAAALAMRYGVRLTIQIHLYANLP